MTNYEKGYSYEDFVETVYNAILEAERPSNEYRSIKLERRKVITSKSKTEAEIDIYWEFEQAAITHAVAIECKNEKRNISIGAVRNFARKISDLSGLKGLMVSSKGFSKNAIKEAQSDQIDLLVIRPQEDKDWEGRLKKVHFNLHLKSPAQFIAIRPYFNDYWMQERGYSRAEGVSFNALNTEIFLVDKSTDFEESVHSLQRKNFFDPEVFGSQTWSKEFVDGWLEIRNQSENHDTDLRLSRFKLDKIEIDYIQSSPHTSTDVIDFSEQALAVMEYISGKSGKFLVLNSGEKKLF